MKMWMLGYIISAQHRWLIITTFTIFSYQPEVWSAPSPYVADQQHHRNQYHHQQLANKHHSDALMRASDADDMDYIIREQDYFYQPDLRSTSEGSRSRRVEDRSKRKERVRREKVKEGESELISQGDPHDDGQCPPPPSTLPDSMCDQKMCRADRECREGVEQCCYNGCLYTCLVTVKPAPVFDWVVEPPRKKSGRAWLVDSPHSDHSRGDIKESCSTTVFQDESRLMCPHGYVCHIDDPGDPDRGVQNRGECVLREHKPEDLHLHHYHMDTPRGYNMTGCKMDDKEYKDDEIFQRHHHVCLCSSGLVRCSVAHWSGDEGDGVFMSVRDALREYTQRDTSSPSSSYRQHHKQAPRTIAEYHHKHTL